MRTLEAGFPGLIRRLIFGLIGDELLEIGGHGCRNFFYVRHVERRACKTVDADRDPVLRIVARGRIMGRVR